MRSLLIILAALFAKKMIRADTDQEDSGEVLDIRTLGRPVVLGELYSAYTEKTLPGFSLWKSDKIEENKRIIYHPASHTEVSTDDSKDNKKKILDVSAQLWASFKAGLVTVDGSGGYLNTESNDGESASVTLSFFSTTRTESLSSDLGPATEVNNCNLMQDKNSQPTHVIASITYGGDCHFEFKKDLSDTDDETVINGRLQVIVNAKVTQINGQAQVDLNNVDKKLSDELTVKLHSDFILEEQPQTFNESLKVYREVSQNFGTKGSLYNQSVPMRIKLIPIKTYCPEDSQAIADIGKSILERATDIRVRLLGVEQKISKLLGSISAKNNIDVNQLLEVFKSGVSSYTLNYEADLQRIIIKGRKGEIDGTQGLVDLIAEDKESEYRYEKLFLYLTERTRQVSAIDIFYTQSVPQNQPQIAKYTKAEVPIALITEPVLFLLTLYVSPNVAEYDYSSWQKDSRTTRWYNNKKTVGKIGQIWRDFRRFFHFNDYKEGTNFFVLFEEESPEEDPTKLLDIQLFIEGKETQEKFELAELLEMNTSPVVTRKSDRKTIEIQVQQPQQLPAPSNIIGILVSLSSQYLAKPSFRKVYPITPSTTPSATPSTTPRITPSVTIDIEDIVPEYTYNVSVSYTTEYGCLTPTIITSPGTFEEMEQTVGCRIQRSLMKVDITQENQDMIPGISVDECAEKCHISPTCSYGWTFQISTGNCYFNNKNSNSTGKSGWAVGTQSCKGFFTSEAWPVVFQKSGEFNIEKNSKLGGDLTMGKEYIITFQLFLSSGVPDGQLGSILHFTTGGDAYGKYCPSLFLAPDHLYLRAAINGNPDFHVNTPAIRTAIWHTIEISQVFIGGSQFVFKMKVNGVTQALQINSGSGTFTNVEIFAGDNQHGQIDGKMKNLKVKTNV